MTVKEKVLLALFHSFSQEISGETLAKELNVTRAAVWKAVNSLREEGLEITSSSGRGYALTSMGERFCLPCIEQQLQTIDPAYQVFFKETIDSTNSEAKRLLASGVKAPFLVLAGQQSAGRGRLGRSFFSPEGGLYMSLVLPDFPLLSGGVRYTAAVALAVAQALEYLTGNKISIKWVNDLYFEGRKICGILTEGIFDMENSRLSHLIVGVGINTREVNFPEDIRDRAGYLVIRDEKKTALVLEIVRRVLAYFSVIDDPVFLEGYRERCFILGERVQFRLEERSMSGKAVSIDDWGGLVIETPEGIFTLQSGEVFLEEEVSVDFQLQPDPQDDDHRNEHLD